MAEYLMVQISDGAILRRTDSINEASNFPEEVPGKPWKWYPVVSDAQPAFNAQLEAITKVETLEADQHHITWTVARRPLIEQRAAVKGEAQRRIVALTGKVALIDCIIKQSNASMRATELNDKRISGGVLTAEEEAEVTALRNLATAIKAIRAASDAVEIMTPIPLDYTANIYWPA